jgi:flagellar biosynthetic protein FliP
VTRLGRFAANRALQRGLLLGWLALLWLAVTAPPAAGQSTGISRANRSALVSEPGAQPPADVPPPRAVPAPLPELDPQQWTSPQGLTASLKVLVMLTVLTLAPSILIMTTCFIRFIVVLSLLRQALGTQQLPPNQVVVSLCLFLTAMVMWPVWRESYEQGVRPYTAPLPGEPPLDELTAFERAVQPMRRFMAEQIDRADNADAVWMFLDFQRAAGGAADAADAGAPQNYDDLPLSVLVPAYMLSELKVSFIIGFQIYLPFLVIDLAVSALLISMGMMMLPPVLISLPLKLLMFVLIDGWFLTVGMLLESVRPLNG